VNTESGKPQAESANRWLLFLVVIVILWLASALRFYQLDEHSFWNDEGNSARLSERALPLIIEGTASDIHPPFYYLALRGWRELLGETEFGLRSFSAFAGILTVALTFALGRQFQRPVLRKGWPGQIVLLAAVLLAAINPALIYYSQETRMYALLALLAALSTLLLWRWLNSRRGLAWAAGYILAASAGLYTHYFFPAVLLFQNLLVIIWLFRSFRALMFSPLQLTGKRPIRKTIWQWLAMMALLLLIYLPWLPVFWRQAGGRPTTRVPLLQFLWDSTNWLAFGETIPPASWVWPTVVLAGLLLWALLSERRQVLIPLLGAAVPVLFMFAAGTTQPTFFKFMLGAVPFFILWLSAAWHFPRRQTRMKWLTFIPPLLLSLPLLWGTFFSLANLYYDPTYARADYRGMAQRIAQDNHPNAGIILTAPNQWEVFTYYHREGAPVYPLPKGQPDPAILEPELSQIAAKHDRLYAIFWGEAQRDPQRVIETWLEQHTFKAAEEWIGDVRFVVYAVPKEPLGTMANEVEVSFGDQLTLQGYTLPSQELAPGEILQLTLFWRADQALAERYKVFLHLVDEEGSLVAQSDSEPAGGLAPTNSWSAGQTVIDNHGLLLPPTLKPGEYTLLMGLYDISDPTARLAVLLDGAAQDAWEIASFTVD
jgi:uncharacterized membrane protein